MNESLFVLLLFYRKEMFVWIGEMRINVRCKVAKVKETINERKLRKKIVLSVTQDFKAGESSFY